MWGKDAMVRNMEPSSVVRSTLSDQTYTILIEWILSRKLPMGERLDFAKLEKNLGVSRTPLNEAVIRLERDGLITNIPRKGKFVVSISLAQVSERFEIRQFLEIGAADWIMENLTPEQNSQIAALCQTMKAEQVSDGLPPDYFQFLKHDVEFHRMIIAVTGSELLSEMHGSLLLNLQLASIFCSLKKKRIRASIEEHEEIVNALGAYDTELFRKASARHLENSKRESLRHVAALENASTSKLDLNPG